MTKKFLPLLLLMTSLIASATQIQFIGLPSSVANGAYVGNTLAIVDGSFANLVCDDFTHTTFVPSGPFTYISSTLPSIGLTRFGDLAKYQDAAILMYQFNTSGSADAAGFNFALWSLFDPAVGPFGDSGALLANADFLRTQGGGITTQAYADLTIFTPTGNATSNQEFLGFNNVVLPPPPVSGVPEPATMALSGIGLLAVALWRKAKV